MTRAKARLRLDLTGNQATSFSVFTTADADAAQLTDTLGSYLDDTEPPGAIFGTTYRRSKTDHVAILHLQEHSRPAEHLHVYMNYRAPSDVPPVPERVMSFEDGLAYASVFSTRPLQFRTRFVYPTSTYKSVMGVPIQLSTSEESAYDEIVGLRVIKLGDEGPLYRVSVESLADSIEHVVEFERGLAISEHALIDAFETAVKYSERFVVKGGSS